MKYLLVVLMAITFMGCSTKYDTIANKDVSLKIRSFWADADYESRVVTPDCDDKIFLPELPPLDYEGLKPLRDLE